MSVFRMKRAISGHIRTLLVLKEDRLKLTSLSEFNMGRVIFYDAEFNDCKKVLVVTPDSFAMRCYLEDIAKEHGTNTRRCISVVDVATFCKGGLKADRLYMYQRPCASRKVRKNIANVAVSMKCDQIIIYDCSEEAVSRSRFRAALRDYLVKAKKLPGDLYPKLLEYV